MLGELPLVEFMYLVFTRMPGESYRRRLRSLLLCLCDVFRALINSPCVLILCKKHQLKETAGAEQSNTNKHQLLMYNLKCQRLATF